MFPCSPGALDMLFSGATNTSQSEIEFLGFSLSVLAKGGKGLSLLITALFPHPSASKFTRKLKMKKDPGFCWQGGRLSLDLRYLNVHSGGGGDESSWVYTESSSKEKEETSNCGKPRLYQSAHLFTRKPRTRGFSELASVSPTV